MTFAQGIILLFTRFPEPGKSKTRLIPQLGEVGAADLQRQMTTTILGTINTFSARENVVIEVHYSGGNVKKMRKWLGNELNFQQQHPGELGERMFTAICSHLGRFNSIILMGSDCPGLDAAVLEEGFASLQHNEVIIGPAFDGGYYLIGVQGTMARDNLHHLFSDVDWGTSNVLEQTLDRVRSLHLRYQLLKKLHDIDTPEDLQHFHNHSNT